MAELLLELLSEEIPARMQARAAEDLKRLVVAGLEAQGLQVGAAQAFATPRRLALVIEDVPAKSPAVSEERKGPRVNAPEQAIAGFVKSAGLRSIKDAQIVKDEKRGDFYVVKIEKPGRKAGEIVAEVVPDVVVKFPWPKSMRFNRFLDGAGTNAPELRWVRPLHSIACLLDGKVVALEIAGLKAGAVTRGHRFHGNEDIKVEGFVDYAKKLKARKVLLLASERAEMIREQAEALAQANKLELVADEALLAENAGLTEWPTVLMGSFDPAFLEVPPECLMLSMKQHQKCFSLKHPRTGKLANKFLLVSNLIAKDGGKHIIAGNEKVIAARLSDARFFWQQDLKRPLDEMRLALKEITFHEKLGSQWDRVERVAELAHQIAGAVDATPEDARRAAQLCKADLVSGMVGEFPELQGLMGRYYAEAARTKPEIARAIELHYKPKGPSDTVPKVDDGDAVAVAVALADKLDTLVGFWAIDEKPTGSKDPYALRRAALGVIRIVLENGKKLPLSGQFSNALAGRKAPDGTPSDLLAFFHDRLKVYLRDQGARHDLIDAVITPQSDDLLQIVRRVEALGSFLDSEDGRNLLAGTKRASNILAAEEKKKTLIAEHVEPALFREDAEKALFTTVNQAEKQAGEATQNEDFSAAMLALSVLREPVDSFFERVLVNDEDQAVRANRLALLARIRAATDQVADFSKIAG
jgi:glycyl-tRNA synthetase beta chain